MSRKHLLERISSRVRSRKMMRIATMNLEYVLEARKNARFRVCLREADVRVCDGAGLAGLSRLVCGMRVARIAGADLAGDVLQLADEQRWRVFFAMREDGLSSFEDVREVIARDFPHVAMEGSDIQTEDARAWEDAFRNLSRTQPHVVLCNFGIPEQEYFLQALQEKLFPVFVMGVGGTCDFLTGKRRRAPRWMRRLGLEWSFRFFQDPRRILRFLRRM